METLTRSKGETGKMEKISCGIAQRTRGRDTGAEDPARGGTGAVIPQSNAICITLSPAFSCFDWAQHRRRGRGGNTPLIPFDQGHFLAIPLHIDAV